MAVQRRRNIERHVTMSKVSLNIGLELKVVQLLITTESLALLGREEVRKPTQRAELYKRI